MEELYNFNKQVINLMKHKIEYQESGKKMKNPDNNHINNDLKQEYEKKLKIYEENIKSCENEMKQIQRIHDEKIKKYEAKLQSIDIMYQKCLNDVIKLFIVNLK